MSNKKLTIIALALIAILIGLLCLEAGLYVAVMMLQTAFVPSLILLAVVSGVLGFLTTRKKSTTAVWAIILVLQSIALLMGLIGLLAQSEAELFTAYCFLIVFTPYVIAQIFAGIMINSIWGEGDDDQQARAEDQ